VSPEPVWTEVIGVLVLDAAAFLIGFVLATLWRGRH
jgi:hypothetical protein